jgi:hypothetical protein
MQSDYSDRKYTAEELAYILDHAKARAEQARHEAQIAFWKEVSARLRRAWSRLGASPRAALDRPVDPSWPHAVR